MQTYLSYNSSPIDDSALWRVIHNGLPLTTDYPTASEAITFAIRAYPNIVIGDSWWNGDMSIFVEGIFYTKWWGCGSEANFMGRIDYANDNTTNI